jgi:hypothetical protein
MSFQYFDGFPIAGSTQEFLCRSRFRSKEYRRANIMKDERGGIRKNSALRHNQTKGSFDEPKPLV